MTAMARTVEEQSRNRPSLIVGWSRLSPEALAAFETRCERAVLPKHAVLFRQGEPHGGTFLIRSGLVQTYYHSDSGKEVSLAYWSDGDLIGGPDFFGRERHVWSAKVVQTSTVLSISGQELMQLAHEVPEVAFALIDALAFKTRWLSLLVQMHCTQPVEVRLTHLLRTLCEMYGVEHAEGQRLRYRFTQEDLASLVGSSRQWVCKNLKRLERAGIVGMRDRYLVIHDPAALARIDRLE